MRKTTILILVAVVAIFALVLPTFGKQYNEKNAGREVSIRWEMVNLRENYSTNSDVIEELGQGTIVTLTGNAYECCSAEDIPTESWKEVTTKSGKTGWVVTESIKW